MPHTKVPIPGTPMLIEDRFGGKKDIFYAAIQRSRMPMVLTDPHQTDNPIVFHNEAFCKLTGYASEEIIGFNCRFLQGIKTDQKQVDLIRNAINNKTDCAVEILNYRKDGTSFWNALFISPVFNDEGDLVYYFSSQLDISRRVEGEEMLRQAQRIETLGQLTGGIAHDFNNMLMVITGNIKMAKDSGDKTAAAGHLDRALAGARSADKLTQQLLSFARKQQLKAENVDLNQIIFGVRDMLERVLSSDIRVTCDLDPTLGQVKVDKVQAENAFVNVFLNARDALKDRTTVGERIITVKTERCAIYEGEHGLAGGDYACVSFTDNANGMPESVRDRIFEPFFTTKEQGKGTGMGMAMVWGFANQSGGKVSVESVIGKGTTIKFLFPMDTVVNAADIANNEVRVLVVEDNEQVCSIAVEFLRSKGYGVRHANCSAEALSMIESGYVPDILFSDIIMPGAQDGVALAKIVRSRYPRMHILLTSGWANNQLDLYDRFDMLPKPYDLDALVARIEDFTKRLPVHEG